MLSESIIINKKPEFVWNHLRTLEDAEKYIPIVTKSEVKGNGVGAIRTCDIQMGEQNFQIQESLEKLDDKSRSMTISIDTAPPPMQNLKLEFSVKDTDNDSSNLSIITNETENPEIIQNVLKMICNGIKEYNEK